MRSTPRGAICNDISDVIDKIGWGQYQRMCFVLCGLDCFVDGAEVLVVSAIIASISEEWELSAFARGSVASLIFLGALMGAAMAGQLADTLGRRPVIVGSYAGIAVCGLLSSIAPNVYILGLLRMLIGVTYGLCGPTTTAMIAEVSPNAYRGQVVTLSCIFFIVGEIFVCTVCTFLMPWFKGPHWRLVCLCSSLPGLVLVPLVYYHLQESPRFLAMQGRTMEACVVLRKMADMNGKPELDISFENAVTPAQPMLDRRLHSHRQHSTMERLRIVFSPRLATTTVAVAYCFLACNILYFGINYQFPQVFRRMRDDQPMVPAMEQMIASVFEIPGMLLATWLVSRDWLGHKQGLAYVSMVTGCLFLAFTTVDIPVNSVAIPCAYLLKFGTAALFSLTWAYSAEVFPSVCRSTGLGLCVAVGRLGSIAVPVVYEFMRKSKDCWENAPYVCKIIHHEWPFLLFTSAMAMILAGVMLWAPVLETKNCRMDDFEGVGEHSALMPGKNVKGKQQDMDI